MSFASSRPLVHWRRRGPFKRQRAGQGRGHGRREEVCDVTVISSRGRWLIQWNPPEPAHHPGTRSATTAGTTQALSGSEQTMHAWGHGEDPLWDRRFATSARRPAGRALLSLSLSFLMPVSLPRSRPPLWTMLCYATSRITIYRSTRDSSFSVSVAVCQVQYRVGRAESLSIGRLSVLWSMGDLPVARPLAALHTLPPPTPLIGSGSLHLLHKCTGPIDLTCLFLIVWLRWDKIHSTAANNIYFTIANLRYYNT
jgi:hypothetical protein